MKKKGFTLIELLAVIIILAIIALIATPIILNVINNARRGTAERSVEGFAAAVNLARVEYMFENQGRIPANFAAVEPINHGGETVTCTGPAMPGNRPCFTTEGIFVVTSCEVAGFTCIWEDGNGAVCQAGSTAPTRPTNWTGTAPTC